MDRRRKSSVSFEDLRADGNYGDGDLIRDQQQPENPPQVFEKRLSEKSSSFESTQSSKAQLVPSGFHTFSPSTNNNTFNNNDNEGVSMMNRKPSRASVSSGGRRRAKAVELIEEIREFAFNITSTREVVNARIPLLKLTWLTIALIAVGYFCSQTYFFFVKLLQAPTSTRIRYNVNSSLIFPIISLCTYNRISREAVAGMNISNDLLSYIMSSFSGMYLFYNQGGNQQYKVNQLDAEYQDFLNTQPQDFKINDFFIKNGMKCESFLLGCTFMGADFECCARVKEELSDIGKCFVMTMSESKNNQIIPGPVGGLKVYVNMWGEDYPPTTINSNPDSGMQIHVSHPESRLTVTSDPLIVFPNTHAMVRLDPIQIRMRGGMGSNNEATCKDDPKLTYFRSYSMGGCFTECIAGLTMRSCDCIQVGLLPLNSVNDSVLCTPYQATTCVLPLFQDNSVEFLWDQYNIKEECDCPLKCDRFVFDKSVSYSTVPNPGFSDAWMDPSQFLVRNSSLNRKRIDKKNMVILDLFYDNLIWTQYIEYETFVFTDFLSALGGQLSAFIGIRLVTFIQVFWYMGMTVRYLIPYYLRQFRERKGLSQPESGKTMTYRRTVGLYPTAGADERGLEDTSAARSDAAGGFVGKKDPNLLDPSYLGGGGGDRHHQQIMSSVSPSTMTPVSLNSPSIDDGMFARSPFGSTFNSIRSVSSISQLMQQSPSPQPPAAGPQQEESYRRRDRSSLKIINGGDDNRRRQSSIRSDDIEMVETASTSTDNSSTNNGGRHGTYTFQL